MLIIISKYYDRFFILFIYVTLVKFFYKVISIQSFIMHNTVKNLIYIEELIKSKANHDQLTKIIAVSKTFPIENVLPLIEHGHLHYGENKVQEALEKWTDIKNENQKLKEDTKNGVTREYTSNETNHQFFSFKIMKTSMLFFRYFKTYFFFFFSL